MEHDPLLQLLINDMPVLADATTPINVFDKRTWSNHDFSRAEQAFRNYIASKPAHNQHGENLVQTSRSMIHCIFIQDFKQWSLAQAREAESDLVKRRKINKIRGKKRVRLFSNWIDRQLRIIEKAEALLGKTQMKEITRNMKNPEERISARDNSKKKVVFLQARNNSKSRLIQVNNLADVTAWMDGSSSQGSRGKI